MKLFLIVLVIITHSEYGLSHREGSFFYPFIIDMAVPCFLVISGYVNTISFSASKLHYGIFYEKRTLFRKISRVAVPFIPFTFIVTFCWLYFDRFSFVKLLYNILFQNWGQGGYYPIIMIQLIILFPLLAKISETALGCIAIVLLDLLSEILFSFLSETSYGVLFSSIHRICILRYLAFIVAGILLYRYQHFLSLKKTILIGIAGLVLVLLRELLCFSDYLFRLWPSTSLPAVLWACFPVMIMILLEARRNQCEVEQSKKKNVFYKCCINLGKASYHIFIIQMMWYFFSAKEGFFPEPPLFFSIIACLMIGFLFYQIDQIIQKKLNGKLNHV